MTRIAVVGGHGKIARQLHPMLLGAGHEPVALVRRQEQADALGAAGVTTRMLDIEGEEADRFAAAFEGCDAVVFAAGGGPDGNIERKRTVDLEGSLKSIEGARQAGCDSFVTKPCLPDALVAEIRRMLARDQGTTKRAGARPTRGKSGQ